MVLPKVHSHTPERKKLMRTTYEREYQHDPYNMADPLFYTQTFHNRYNEGTAISRWLWYEPPGRTSLHGNSSHWSLMKRNATRQMWELYLGSKEDWARRKENRPKSAEPVCSSGLELCCEDDLEDRKLSTPVPLKIPSKTSITLKVPQMEEPKSKDFQVDPAIARNSRGFLNVIAKRKPKRFWPLPMGSPNTDDHRLGIGDRLMYEIDNKVMEVGAQKKGSIFKSVYIGINTSTSYKVARADGN